MKSRVHDVSGELTLVIPLDVAATANIVANSDVDVVVESGAIVVRPVDQSTYSLMDLLAKVTPENIHAETEWGPPVGREVW